MDHLLDDEELPRHERELTLSTGAILGIFLGLAVLCGGFFGFGYNMGRKSAPTPLSLSDINTDASLPAASGTQKPAAGTPLSDNTSALPATTVVPKPPRKPVPAPATSETSSLSSSTEEAPVVRPITPRPTPAAPGTAAAPIVRQPAPVSPAALSPSAASTSSSPAVAGGTFMVQVAAVSHQEDADLLVGALRGRGYAVSAHPAASDRFIHVQVGPFHDKKEADAMRQRLLTDGYNAIVK